MKHNFKIETSRIVKLLILSFAFLQITQFSNAQNIKSTDLKKDVLTLGFIENKGQIIDQNNNLNQEVKFLLNMPGLNVQLKENGFSYDAYVAERQPKEKLQNEIPGLPEPLDDVILFFQRIDIEFIGANASPKLIAENPGFDYLNYYTTATPEEGITFVRHFRNVIFKDLYPGIDLLFKAQAGKGKPVEYNFIVHPGADISLLKWKYKGHNGIKIQDGSICIQTVYGSIKESIPLAWEKETSKIIGVSYHEIESGIFTFSGNYNSENTLVIDPVPDIKWATYYGGSGNDQTYGVSYDSVGNVYVTGETTSSSNIATSGTQQTTYAGGTVQYNLGGDAIVLKFTSSGTRIWGTYYGGTGEDLGYSIRTNHAGDSYISGDTKSTSSIATSGAFQTSMAGSYHDVFLAKFNTSGIRQWGTYYGGTGNDRATYNGMAMDDSGNVFITGINNTANNNWITTKGCYQSTNGSTSAYDEPFASKWSPSGKLVWGTYYGGTLHDQGYAIAVDDSGNVYLTGACTSTSGFASTGAYQTSLGGGTDAFLVKLNNTGTARIWGTYYGGTGNDYGRGITVDKSGNVFVSGYTSTSSGFSTSGAHQSTYGGGSYDGFLAKFNSSGSRVWNTYYGGGGTDVFTTLSLNSSNDLVLSGYIDSNSISAGLPTSGAYQTKWGGGINDGVIAKFSSSGSRKWCTYFGGEVQDLIFNHILDPNGSIFIVGRTLSTSGLATTGAHQTSYAGGTMDGFVGKLLDQPILLSSITTIQPDTNSIPAGSKNKMIIGLKVNTTGYNPFAKITQFSFDTSGIFNYSNITGTAKVYYTGNTDTFNTNKLFDSTTSKPTAAFSISGSQVLDTGIVYFWLTFDVDFNATVNNYLDAKCTQIRWDSGGTTLTKTPLITSPSGKIRITAPLKTLSSISFSQPSTYYVYRYSTDNPVLRLDINVAGTAGTLNFDKITVLAKNTDNSDVSNVKLFFTTTTTFNNSNQIGSATTFTNGTTTFSSLKYSLPSGNSYIWVTYDIPGSATIFDTVDAIIPVNGVGIGGKLSPSTEQNPTGYRIIYTNFQYDAGISSVISPTYPFCKTFQTIKARLYNYGTSTLTSDTVKWTINGVAQNPYIWNGTLATGNSVDLTLGSYTFSMSTAYIIKVYPSYVNGIYTDSYLQNDTAIRTFTIYPIPVAGFTVNDSLQCFKGNSFVFSNTSTIGSGTFTSYWNFGDASYSNTTSTSHTYQSLSTFPVKLIVTSAYGCSDSITKNVSLKPNQTTAFSMSDTAGCLNGNSFNFTNNTTFGSGSYSSLWKFGDNTTSTTSSPSHSYNSTGIYQVKLITTTNTGCIDSLWKTVYVNFHPLTSFHATTDTSQCFGNNLFKITNTTTIGSGTFTNLWNFGDNTTSTTTNPSKSYNTTGTFTIKLITTSDNGCKDSITKKFIVFPNPNTDFKINDSSQCNNANSFVFTNASSITSGSYTNLWNFGDMSTSTTTSPTKTYTKTGTFDIKLVTKSNYGCLDSLSKKVYVRPVATTSFLINDSDQCFKANSFIFNNISTISTGSYTNSWKFGDNTVSTVGSPTKNYSNIGIYVVKLVTTSNYGCKDSLQKNVYVRPHPQSSFTINDSSQCFNVNSFKFTNNSTISTGSFTNLWEFGDNNKSTVLSPTYTYTTQGNYTVRLTTTSNEGCKDFVDRKVLLNPRPYSYFTTGVNPQCLRSNLFILDNRSSVSSGTIKNSYWKFGDGDSSDLTNPQHKYKTSGTFTIFQKVVTDFGCTDTSSKQVEVNPQPLAGMILNDTALCFKNHVFQFTDNSTTGTGTITGYYWNFGNGKSSILKNPSHSYSMSKSYLITHIVTSSNDCTDTITKTIYVYPMPVASFEINNATQCLKGNSFIFTDGSTSGGGSLTYNWLFGDGGSSNKPSPSYSYTNFGVYNVKLKTITSNNCIDTLEKTVTVKESPIVDLGKDTVLYHNQSITLNAGNGFDSYEWSNNSNTPTIFVDSTGIGLDKPALFWVKVKLQDCDGNDSIVITFTKNISIKDKNEELKILVYPNPARDFIYLETGKEVQDITITLTDMNGKMRITESLESVNKHRIDLSNLSEGIYFLKINNQESNATLKVIKY